MGPLWTILLAVLTLFVVIQGIAVVGILRRVSVVLEQAEDVLRSAGKGPGGLEPGAELPEFEGLLIDGSQFTETMLVGRASVILFMSRNCPACQALVGDLQGRDTSLLREHVVVVVGDSEYAAALADATALTVVTQHERSIAERFESKATPQAFAIAPDGVIVGKGIPNRFESLRQLVLLARGGDPAERKVLVGVEE